MAGQQGFTSRLLWSVNTAVQRTNERVAGITGTNPVQLGFYKAMMIQVSVSVNTNLGLTKLRVYSTFTGNAGQNNFPTPGDDTTPIILHSPAAPLAAGQAVTMIACQRASDGTFAPSGEQVFGNWYVLEYSTAAAGATPSLIFAVSAIFLSQPLSLE